MGAGFTVDEVARLRHLAETQRAIAAHPPGNSGPLQSAAEQARAITAADAAIVAVLDGDRLSRRVATGTMADSVGTRMEVANSLAGRCVRLAVPMRCVDAEFDTRVDQAACRRSGVRSMLVVPIIHGGVAVGVLQVVSARPDHFGEPDAEVLQEMAGLIAGHTAAQRRPQD